MWMRFFCSSLERETFDCFGLLITSEVIEQFLDFVLWDKRPELRVSAETASCVLWVGGAEVKVEVWFLFSAGLVGWRPEVKRRVWEVLSVVMRVTLGVLDNFRLAAWIRMGVCASNAVCSLCLTTVCQHYQHFDCETKHPAVALVNVFMERLPGISSILSFQLQPLSSRACADGMLRRITTFSQAL